MSVKKSLAWMGAGQLLSIALQFASSIVLARYLSPLEMGLVAVAFAVVAILSIFQQLGLNVLIVRERELTDELRRSAFTVNLVVTCTLSVVIVLVSYAGAFLVNDDRVRHLMLVLAICPLFGIVDFLPAAHLEREGRFKALAAIALGASLLGTTTTICLVLQGWTYMSLAFGHVVLTGSYAAMATFLGRKHFSCRLGLRAWRRTTEFGFLSLAISGVVNISQRVSEITLGRFLGLAAVGIFSRANTMNLLIWNNVHVVISRVLLVDFAGVHREGSSLRERYLTTASIVTAVLWPAFAGLAITSKSFIPVVYGEKWLPAAPLLVFLSIASMIQVSVTMTPEIFSIKDEMRTQTKIETLRALAGVAMFTAACSISLEAAAATRVLEAALAWVLYRPHLNRMTDTRFSDLIRIYSGSFLLTGIAAGPSTLLILARPSGRLTLFELLGTVLVGAMLWAVALIVTRHPLGLEARAVWGRRQLARRAATRLRDRQ